jgi:hypothetical protein
MENEANYVCTQCKKAYPKAEFCPVHPEEPLLNASDKEICFFLMGLDDQARNKAYGLWITLGLIAGVVAGIALVWALKTLIDLDLGYVKGLFFGGIAGGATGTAVAKMLFKPKYRQFTERLERLE